MPADVAIVGEAPGKTEAKLGVAFSGPLFRYVNALVETLVGRRTYVTNAVQRPRWTNGRIRKTTLVDVLEDLPLLERELGRVKPAITIALGKKAENALVELGFEPIVLPHPRYAKIRKNAWHYWTRLIRETVDQVNDALGG